MTSGLETLVAELVTVIEALADLDRDGEVSLPRPGGSAGAIEHAQQVRGKPFHEGYVEFLRLHDGWPDFPWGMNLFGTDELSGSAYDRAVWTLNLSLEHGDLPAEIKNALIIAESDNDASLVLLLDTGEVVEYLYEETGRHEDFVAYLAEQLVMCREFRDETTGLQARARADWDAEQRAGKDAALLAELRPRLAGAAPDAGPVEPPAANDPMPAEVHASDLAIMGGERKNGRKPKELAAVTLHLELYLGSYPSPDEVLACFRAFRRHFPVPGRLKWGLPDRFYIPWTTTKDPDDESWAEELRVNTDGLFGVRLSIKVPAGDRKRRYTLNVCGIPPTDDGTPRASFCEVIVPADEAPERLAALTRELVDLLPVRSGHAGYAAYVSGEERYYHDVFGWCRRFFGLGVGYVDGWLEAAVTRVVGASWLTVLGPVFTGLLGDGAPPSFQSREIVVDESAGGVVIRAGAAPSLGDVQRGEFPVLVAEVERYLRPLKVTGWHRVSLTMISGHTFTAERRELPGGFDGHRMTGAWLDRLVDPQRFLGPSPREHAAELLVRLHAEHGGEWLDQWHKEIAEDGGYFHILLGLLFNASCASCADAPSDTCVRALELVTLFGDDAPPEAYNNLMYAYLARGELDQGLAFLPTALEIAPRNPHIYHQAASLAARLGDLDQALALTEAAKQHGYEHLADMRADENLRGLRDDPRFSALFE